MAPAALQVPMTSFFCLDGFRWSSRFRVQTDPTGQMKLDPSVSTSLEATSSALWMPSPLHGAPWQLSGPTRCGFCLCASLCPEGLLLVWTLSFPQLTSLLLQKSPSSASGHPQLLCFLLTWPPWPRWTGIACCLVAIQTFIQLTNVY